MANNVKDILERSFSSRSYEEKLQILNTEKPKPALHNLVCSYRASGKDYTRHFATSHYENVDWLTGCETRSKLFCWPCLLFSRERSVWNKQGYADLGHLTSATQKHERSQAHVKAFLDYRMFGQQRSDTLINGQQKSEVNRHNEQVKKNRKILKRIIDAMLYLTKQGLPLRGHDESHSSTNRGNYIELLNLLREYDPLLNEHLNTSPVFQGTFPIDVQNDIVKAMSHVIMCYIKKEISSASFVAVILDETSDIMSKSQLSTVLRFVQGGKVYERFVGFTDVSADRTALGLFRHVVRVVEDFQIQDKLVGQTYDGASVMSGHINGLQRKVHDKYPLAIFTHCYAHVLNFVLQQSLSNIKECKIFFQTLSGLAAFFSKSSKRVHALQEFVSRLLPSAAPTKWNFTSRLSNTLQTYRLQFIGFFKDITENPEGWDSDTIVKAQGFLTFLEHFQSILLLEIFSKLFGSTDVLYNVLQSKVHDVSHCCKKIDDMLQQLQHDREHAFEVIWAAAISKTSDHGNSALFNTCDNENQRSKRCKLAGDEKYLYCVLFRSIVDSICVQITSRYSALSKLEFFQLLWYEKYEAYKNNFPDHLLTKLKNFYGSRFDYVRLKNELLVVYASPVFSQKNVHELIAMMVESSLTSGFKEVFQLGKLILTIPSNTASAERTFSALKQIYSCFHGSQSQEKLSGLSLISIEKSVLMQLKHEGTLYDKIIDQFTSQRRRIELTYK